MDEPVRSQVPVVRLERGGSPITKTGQVFTGSAIAVLEDGRKQALLVQYRLKRDVVAYLDKLPQEPPENPMWACYRDGRYVGTRTSYSLTGRRPS